MADAIDTPAAMVSCTSITVVGFGAKADGTTDDTASIQAAIDYAVANKIQAVHLPAGRYRTTKPIYLDPPGNLRTDVNSPTQFGFSLALIGDEGLGNDNQYGAQLVPDKGDYVVLWVGPGQGMRVKGIQIFGPQNVKRTAMPATGCGMALSGGPGGSSRTLIENCGIFNLSNGIAYGFNVDQLCDSNTLTKCFINNCFKGVSYLKSQVYINSLYECSIAHCNTAIYNPPNKSVSVFGGNFSCGGEAAAKKATIGAVSALSAFSDTIGGNTFSNYRFTAVVANPDANWINGVGTSVYNRAALNLPGFGLVPLKIESYQSGTVTLAIWPYWRAFHFGMYYDLIASSDLQAEIRAATVLYCCEQMTVFSGGNFHVKGMHIENSSGANGSLTCLLDAGTGVNSLEDVFFNYDPSFPDLAGNSGDAGAAFICQQSHPLLRYANCKVRLKDFNWGQTMPSEGVVFDVGARARLTVEGDPPFSPIIRYCDAEVSITGWNNIAAETRLRGHGDFELSPFLPLGLIGNGGWTNYYLYRLTLQQGRMRGLRPDPQSLVRLTPAQLAALSAAKLPALGSYPPLNGETVYSCLDWNSPATAQLWTRSAHQFYSYGQNITAGISYKGQTTRVTIDAAGLKWMFPGLKIILDNGADGEQGYLVVGVHSALGYVDALGINEHNSALVGGKTSRYTASVIRQEIYAWPPADTGGGGSPPPVAGDQMYVPFVEMA